MQIFRKKLAELSGIVIPKLFTIPDRQLKRRTFHVAQQNM
jgi:hypothetical protein